MKHLWKILHYFYFLPAWQKIKNVLAFHHCNEVSEIITCKEQKFKMSHHLEESYSGFLGHCISDCVRQISWQKPMAIHELESKRGNGGDHPFRAWPQSPSNLSLDLLPKGSTISQFYHHGSQSYIIDCKHPSCLN